MQKCSKYERRNDWLGDLPGGWVAKIRSLDAFGWGCQGLPGQTFPFSILHRKPLTVLSLVRFGHTSVQMGSVPLPPSPSPLLKPAPPIAVSGPQMSAPASTFPDLSAFQEEKATKRWYDWAAKDWHTAPMAAGLPDSGVSGRHIHTLSRLCSPIITTESQNHGNQTSVRKCHLGSLPANPRQAVKLSVTSGLHSLTWHVRLSGGGVDLCECFSVHTRGGSARMGLFGKTLCFV